MNRPVPDVVTLLCDMLRFDTTNPPGNEKPLAEMLAALLADFGFAAEITDLGDNRANLTARLRGSGERGALLLNGHLDVVPPGDVPWDSNPFTPDIRDGRVYGRGSSDMKGGLAAMVVAALTVAASGRELKGDLILTGSADEESNSLGARDFRARGGLDGVDAIIVGEPSSCGINVAHKGALWVEITTLGKTAHGAFPQEGVNAVAAMGVIMNKISAYRPEHVPHALLGTPTVNVATIHGGVKTNVVPDRCVMTLDIRTVPGMSHESILADVTALAREAAAAFPGLDVTVAPFNDRPPVATDGNHPFVRTAQKVIAERFGKTAEPGGVSFYTDAAVFLPGNAMPVILYGPGEASMAHRPNEFVPIEALHEAVAFYAGMIEQCLLK